jgi:branched-chain amino acid transport system substrate-binding protein
MKVLHHKTLSVLVLVVAVSLSSFAGTLRQGDVGEPIRVGVFLDLSGMTAQFGQPTLSGVRMAAAEINDAGGIDGRKLELIVEDDRGRPEEAATVVRKLIEQKKVHALLGDVASGNSIAAGPSAQHFKVPMITPASTHPAVTQVGTYIFAGAFSDPFQGAALAKFAVKTLKAKRVAMLIDPNSSYSKSLSTTFQNRLVKLGGQVVMTQSYAIGDRDFMAQLVAIKSARPDVIVIPGYYTEVGMIAKQAKQIRLNKPLLGGDGWDSPQIWELAGDALNGAFITNHYANDNPSIETKDFVGKYKARYEGKEPDALAALGYDAVKLLANAIRRAGSTEASALQKALASTRNFACVTGPITMDENRNPIKPVVILKLQNRKFVYHATVLPDK